MPTCVDFCEYAGSYLLLMRTLVSVVGLVVIVVMAIVVVVVPVILTLCSFDCFYLFNKRMYIVKYQSINQSIIIMNIVVVVLYL